MDDGFAGDDDADSGKVVTEGVLHSRYSVGDGEKVTGLRAVLDALIEDANRLGIQFREPQLYYHGDGEYEDCPAPEGWRKLLETEAARLGWGFPYAPEEEVA